jgi:hypothetical protein
MIATAPHGRAPKIGSYVAQSPGVLFPESLVPHQRSTAICIVTSCRHGSTRSLSLAEGESSFERSFQLVESSMKLSGRAGVHIFCWTSELGEAADSKDSTLLKAACSNRPWSAAEELGRKK